MPAKVTTSEFIERAKSVHGDKYDYSKTFITSMVKNTTITCPIHGDFETRAANHLLGVGCSECSGNKKLTTESFIKKAHLVHGDRYDYSKSNYVGAKTKVIIVCHKHGEFLQSANDHLSGRGCKSCGVESRTNKNRLSHDEFIERAIEVHGNKYDYSNVNYVNFNTKILIKCQTHGLFSQTPASHLSGNGCNICNPGPLGSNTVRFIEKANSIHSRRYSYSNTEYINSKTKVKINCIIHGCYEQLPNDHLDGHGCPKCGDEINRQASLMTQEEFVEKATSIHGDKYDYSKTKYVNARSEVIIICKKHGEFKQRPTYHLNGNGCQACGSQMSKGEDEICNLLDSLGVNYYRRDRTLIKPLELDIVIPEHNLAIEFNGLIWHSEKYGKDRHYHSHKTNLCAEKGYRLIHIWEDDWRDRKDIELAFIKQLVGKSNSDVVYARKCTVNNIDYDTASEFLNQYHIQGSVRSSVSLGLYFGDELVGVTCFTRRGDTYELTRHATSTRVIGALGKTVKFFGKDCYTFCDLSRYSGCSYLKAGFIKSDEIDPDYKYIVNGKREHKFLWRRGSIKNKRPDVYSEDLSEREMMEKAEYPRIWDCGKIRYCYVHKTRKARDEIA